MDYTRQLIICLLCLGVVVGETAFSLTSCMSSPQTELLTVNGARVDPHPILIPGDVSVSAELQLKTDIDGNVSLEVTIERHVGFFWLTVPCISNIGSCTYSNICDFLASKFGNNEKACPAEMKNAGLLCSCPIPVGTYTMTNLVFSIPKPKGILSYLASGDYRVTAKLKDRRTGEEIGCQKLHVSIKDNNSCSGILCSFLR